MSADLVKIFMSELEGAEKSMLRWIFSTTVRVGWLDKCEVAKIWG